MSKTRIRINIKHWKRVLTLFYTSLVQNDGDEVHAGGM